MYLVFTILEWKFDLAEKRGIAVLVTCDYDGTPHISTLKATNDDAREMRKTFEQLGYDIKQLKNEEATVPAVSALVAQLSQYMKEYNGPVYNDDGGIKAITFAFAGHGSNENVVFTNDNQNLFLRDVVKPLVDPASTGRKCHKIPKLFFIDACRGTKDITVPRARAIDDIEGNFNIEYATIEGYKAFDDSWTPVLARELRENEDTYQNVMAEARRKAHEKYKLQQPQAQVQVNIGPFKLYYKEKREK